MCVRTCAELGVLIHKKLFCAYKSKIIHAIISEWDPNILVPLTFRSSIIRSLLSPSPPVSWFLQCISVCSVWETRRGGWPPALQQLVYVPALRSHSTVDSRAPAAGTSDSGWIPDCHTESPKIVERGISGR